MVFLEELVFLLEGHVAYLAVFVDELLERGLHVVGGAVKQFLELGYDFLLAVQVLLFLVACAGGGVIAGFKELVAGGYKLGPELVAHLLGHHADGLPLLLQLDELVGGGFPVGRVHEGLGLFYHLLLLLGVLGEFLLQSLEELSLAAEKVIAGGAEAVEYLDIHLLRSKADGLPFGLDIYNLLGVVLPVGGVLVFLLGDGFHLLAECGLACQVFLFLGAQLFEVLLVALVDYGRRSLEACPYLLAQFLCDRTYLAILLVQLLQLVERADDVLLVGELLCSLAELGLHLEVLLEVVFASLRVELEQVVELLYI